MLRRTFTGLTLAAFAAAGFVSAQVSTTLTLRSGEQISGQLVDMGGSGFAVRVGGQDRQIPTGEVALIDFGGGTMSQADWDRVSGGQHVIWLRSGEVLTGQLVDVGGTSPLRISVRVNGNDRDLTSNEVARIALVRPSSTGQPSTPGEGQGITVQGNQQWTATGLALRRGEWVTVKATGEIRLSSDSNDVATPSGVLQQRFDRRAPLPSVLAGALIGRIGNGRPFGIGTDNRFQADAGQLFLGINDSNVSDNQGAFQVDIQRSGAPVRRQ
jgi:hypothetical protein